MSFFSNLGKYVSGFLIHDKPGDPTGVSGAGVKVTIPLPLVEEPVKVVPPAASVEIPVASLGQSVDNFVASVMGVQPVNLEHGMNFSKIVSLFSLASSVVGPLVAMADTFHIPGAAKLDAVVSGVKKIATVGSDVVVLAEEEWAMLKPSVDSLVSAFADVKHALEASASAQDAATPPPAPPVKSA